MTDSQRLRIQSCLNAAGLYVGHEARGRLCAEARCGMARTDAPWHRGPAAYGRETRSIVARPTGAIRPSGLQADPDRFAVRRDSMVVRAHASATGAPPKETDPALDRSRAASVPRSISWRIEGIVPCTCAYDADAWLARQGITSVIPARPAYASPALRPGTRRATSRHGASAGSNAGGAWPRAMTNTRIVAWIFCAWRAP